MYNNNTSSSYVTDYKGYRISKGIDEPKEKYLANFINEESAYYKTRVFDTQADAVQWVDIETFDDQKRSWRRYYIGLGAVFCAMQFLIIYLSKHV